MSEKSIERVVLKMMNAIAFHGEETGHDVSRFATWKDQIRPRCEVCGAVMYDEPELDWEGASA